MGKFTVLGIPLSTATQRVLFTLEEKGAPYQFQLVDFKTAQHKSPEYLENEHPFGQVPVFHDDDFKLFESRAICRYIDDVVPDHPLIPKDPKAKALVEQFISIETSDYISSGILISELIFKKFRSLPTDEAAVQDHTQKLHAFFKVFNKLIDDRSYLVGDSFTLADLVFVPNTDALLSAPEMKNVLDDYPNIARWWKAVSARPAWQRVLALKQNK